MLIKMEERSNKSITPELTWQQTHVNLQVIPLIQKRIIKPEHYNGILSLLIISLGGKVSNKRSVSERKTEQHN